VATAAGLIFGTARYISPEGAQGNAVGPASDVYSIATLLYQMLAGRTPFEGDQAVGLLVSQIHDAPPHLKSLPRAEYVPDPLAEVIMANLVKDPNRREQDARALGHAIIDAAKEAGLAPEDISRPMLRRQPSAMQLSPTKRTKDLDLSPEVSERLSLVALPAAHAAASPPNGAGRDRAPMGATAKWEPPTELQARLTAVAEGTRDSGVVPARSIATTPSRPRTPASVDATMDDASLEGKSMPRTMPGDVELRAPATQYAAPAPGLTDGPAHVGSAALPSRAEPSRPLPVPEGTSSPTRLDGGDEPRRSRGVPFVLLCFALGAALAAGWAWRTGKLGGADADDEHYVSRATDAMYKNRFVTPPGDNVREITDEGLKKWPNHHRLLDVRMRAANELVSQAMTQRSAGDIVEALRVARAAHELDPNDASAKRLVDQYEGELAAFTTPTATPLNKTAPVVPVPNGRPPLVVPSGNLASSAATPFKAILETNVAQPRLGQTIELTARVAPAKGTFEAPLFTLNGPGLGAGVTMPAQSPAPGVFKASYAFLEGGRFDATFTAQAEGKPLRAMRAISVGDPTQPKPADPPPKPTAPTPTASVKWM
jgi:serine/threonine-protein kinase